MVTFLRDLARVSPYYCMLMAIRYPEFGPCVNNSFKICTGRIWFQSLPSLPNRSVLQSFFKGERSIKQELTLYLCINKNISREPQDNQTNLPGTKRERSGNQKCVGKLFICSCSKEMTENKDEEKQSRKLPQVTGVKIFAHLLFKHSIAIKCDFR